MKNKGPIKSLLYHLHNTHSCCKLLHINKEISNFLAPTDNFECEYFEKKIDRKRGFRNYILT